MHFSLSLILFILKVQTALTIQVLNHFYLYKGVPAGIAYDGSIAYVGLVNVTCNNVDTGVARISTNPKNPGGFYSCQSTPAVEKLYQNVTIFYVLINPSLKWKKVTLTTLNSNEICRFSSSNINIGYGRYFHPNGFVIIGQVEILYP